MNFTSFATSLRTITGTTESTLPLSKIVAFCNIELDTYGLLGSLPGLNEEYFSKTYSHDLEAGIRQYTLPFDLTHIKNVAVKIAGEWEDATQYIGPDIQEESDILELMKGQKPMYRIHANTIKIYSKEAITLVTGGIRMEGTMYPTEFSEADFTTSNRDMSIPRDTSSQGLPRQFHKVLLYRVSILWKNSRDKPLSLNDTEKNYQGNLADVIEALGLFVVNRRYRMSEPNDAYSTQEKFDPLSS